MHPDLEDSSGQPFPAQISRVVNVQPERSYDRRGKPPSPPPSNASAPAPSASSEFALASARCREIAIDVPVDRQARSRRDEATKLVWQNVSFSPQTRRCSLSTAGLRVHRERRRIISNLTGELAAGELKAIIGPSGVGKSTLLKIITGRRVTDVSGSVFIRGAYVRSARSTASASGGQSRKTLARIAYIPQNDFHLRGLTVRESLLFASKLKNFPGQPIDDGFFDATTVKLSQMEVEPVGAGGPGETEAPTLFSPIGWPDGPATARIDEHRRLVASVLKVLMLEDCADTMVTACSGGQVRRLSIGVELLSFPQLIVLDEPTTGLDFVSALQTVRLLRALTESSRRPGIICTIHQPASVLLQLFTSLYVIGQGQCGGVCVYDGPTDRVDGRLDTAGLRCPPYFNVADFLLQCSYGELGDQVVPQLARSQSADHERRGVSTSAPARRSRSEIPIDRHHQQMVDAPRPFHYQLLVLLDRTLRNQLRTSQIIALKLASSALIALFLGSLHNYHLGEKDYCVNGPLFLEVDMQRTSFQAFALLTQNAAENVACTSYLLMFVAFVESIPTCLTFSREVHVLIKEKSNGWYSCGAYFLAKTLVEMPFQFLGPLLSLSIYYPLTGQSSEYWRFGLILSAFILCALIVRLIGMLVGSIFIDDEFSGVLTISALIAVFILVGGMFIRDSQVAWPVQPFYFVSVIKFCFHIVLNAIYGLGRCDTRLPLDFPLEYEREQLEKFSGSLMLMWFEVQADDFWLAYIGLSTLFVVLVVLTYLVLDFQISRLSRE